MVSLYPNLDTAVKENKLSYSQLAQEIGMSSSTIYRRLRGEGEWLLPEAVAICQRLNVKDLELLFLRFDINHN